MKENKIEKLIALVVASFAMTLVAYGGICYLGYTYECNGSIIIGDTFTKTYACQGVNAPGHCPIWTLPCPNYHSGVATYQDEPTVDSVAENQPYGSMGYFTNSTLCATQYLYHDGCQAMWVYDYQNDTVTTYPPDANACPP